MINREFLEKLAVKKQIGVENILREYTQHLFLSHFYALEESEKMLFKGGTALKLVFESPRYSEDLDFTGLENSGLYENLLEEVMVGLDDQGIDLDLVESKPTTGGQIGILRVNIFGRTLEIKSDVSLRKSQITTLREAIVVNPEYTPSYNIYLLKPAVLIEEKIIALLTRSKSRDLFDLYFILRSPRLRRELNLNEEQRSQILSLLKKQDKKKLQKDLQQVLPKNFWRLLSDLPASLERELERT